MFFPGANVSTKEPTSWLFCNEFVPPIPKSLLKFATLFSCSSIVDWNCLFFACTHPNVEHNKLNVLPVPEEEEENSVNDLHWDLNPIDSIHIACISSQTCRWFQHRICTLIQTFYNFFHITSLNIVRLERKRDWNTTYNVVGHYDFVTQMNWISIFKFLQTNQHNIYRLLEKLALSVTFLVYIINSVSFCLPLTVNLAGKCFAWQ